MEIRLRALKNIISKLELGVKCDCNAVKKELLVKLFRWFSVEPIIEEGTVLDLIVRLIKVKYYTVNFFITCQIHFQKLYFFL